jgi:hypothetical protein
MKTPTELQFVRNLNIFVHTTTKGVNLPAHTNTHNTDTWIGWSREGGTVTDREERHCQSFLLLQHADKRWVGMKPELYNIQTVQPK